MPHVLYRSPDLVVAAQATVVPDQQLPTAITVQPWPVRHSHCHGTSKHSHAVQSAAAGSFLPVAAQRVRPGTGGPHGAVRNGCCGGPAPVVTGRDKQSSGTTALVIKQPALLLDGTVSPTLNCDISPASGGIIVGSGILPSGEAAAHIHGRLQGIDTAVTRLEVDVLSVDAWLLESQGANRATNLPPHGPTELNGMASLFNPIDRKRTWALFGSGCVKEHRNSSCWIHPAVADASLQLTATVASQSQIRSVGGAVLAACGAYAPMRRLAASSAAVGAAVMQDGGSSNTWLLSLRQQLLATLSNQFKALKAAETPSTWSGAVSPCGVQFGAMTSADLDMKPKNDYTGFWKRMEPRRADVR